MRADGKRTMEGGRPLRASWLLESRLANPQPPEMCAVSTVSVTKGLLATLKGRLQIEGWLATQWVDLSAFALWRAEYRQRWAHTYANSHLHTLYVT